MSRHVLLAGVGMTSFTKPGRSESYSKMGEEAARKALEDADIDYQDVDQVYAGFVYADSTAGQAAMYGLGLTGVPIVNVNNNCATGSTALFLARQAVANGTCECAMAVGFEQMIPGALGDVFNDRPAPMSRQASILDKALGESDAPPAARYFGGAGQEYADMHGTRPETFGKIAEKARRHAANNPLAVFHEPLSLDEIMASPTIYGPLTRLQCCPPTCGGAAAIVCSEEFARKNGIDARVRIRAQSMKTDLPAALESGSLIKLIGFDMARAAADEVYDQAGIGPDEVDVVELHDCFTANELLTYEAIRLADDGDAEKYIWDNQNTYGGSHVVNPSGGLLSKGHPLGATGLAQCAELAWQLRGTAERRQVEGARLALQHNLGLGGACVMTLFEKV